MNIRHTFNKYRAKYYASGSPLRYVRKLSLELADPSASRERARLGSQLVAGLSGEVQKRVADLQVTGYADGGDEIDAALLAELRQSAEARIAGGFQGAKIRSFFTKMTTDEDLQSDSIYVRFALQPSVQKLVCSYFNNTVPYLAEISMILSTGTEAGKWSESQLWHLDYGDAPTILLWVYLSDVHDVESGPFTYIPAVPSRKVPNTFFPKRVPDETVDSLGLAGEARSVFGPKGKVFYIDTSRCYHLGSRLMPGHERLVYLATFTTHKPLYPLVNGVKIGDQLSDIEKLLLTRQGV
jgi:hypothetical protein